MNSLDFFRIKKCQKGFTLVEVLMASAIMGGVALGLAFLMKQQSDATIKNANELDITQAKAEIVSMLVSPGHCNANFKGLSLSAAKIDLPAGVLSRCKGAGASPQKSCFDTSAANKETRFTKLVEVDPDPTDTEVWTGGGFAPRNQVKISSIKYSTPASVSIIAPATVALTTLTLEVTFRTKKPNGARPQTIDKGSPPTFAAVVLVDSGGTIVGCPKTWNSTVVYQ